MNATKVLRVLVLCEVALLAATVAVSILPEEPIPAIDEYLEGPGAGPLWRLVDTEPTAVTYLLWGVLIAFAGLYITSLVGLLLLKHWSRRLYAITFIVGVCLYPFMGSSLVDPVSGTLDYILAACSGAILAILFLSDAKTLFESRIPDTSLERSRER